MEQKNNSENCSTLFHDFSQEQKSLVSRGIFGPSYLNDSSSKYIIINIYYIYRNGIFL